MFGQSALGWGLFGGSVANLGDVAVITTTTLTSSTDISDVVESNTITTLTSVTYDEQGPTRFDADTVTSTTTVTYDELTAKFYLDSDVTSTVSTLSSAELHEISDQATIATKTTFGGLDVLYQDAATFSTVTTITKGELDYVHPTGYWGPFDTDTGLIP